MDAAQKQWLEQLTAKAVAAEADEQRRELKDGMIAQMFVDMKAVNEELRTALKSMKVVKAPKGERVVKRPGADDQRPQQNLIDEETLDQTAVLDLDELRQGYTLSEEDQKKMD